LEQNLRSFIERVKQLNPSEVVHIQEEIDPKYEISTLIMESLRFALYRRCNLQQLLLNSTFGLHSILR